MGLGMRKVGIFVPPPPFLSFGDTYWPQAVKQEKEKEFCPVHILLTAQGREQLGADQFYPIDRRGSFKRILRPRDSWNPNSRNWGSKQRELTMVCIPISRFFNLLGAKPSQAKPSQIT